VVPTLPYGLYHILLPIVDYLNPEDMYLFGLASCAESIYAGSTTVLHTLSHVDHFAKAAEEVGLRTVVGELIPEADFSKLKDGIYEYLPEQADESFKRAINLVERWHGKAEGRITAILSFTARKTILSSCSNPNRNKIAK